MKLDEYKCVWVIGASRGIGKAVVSALDHPSRQMVLSARNHELLNQVSASMAANSKNLAFDITDEDAVDHACMQMNQLLVRSEPLGMVILNAGTCEYMNSDQLDLAMLNRVMQTNFFSIIRLVDRILPMLRSAMLRGISKPKLVIMSSSVTYQALPRAHAYGASKTALRYFAECLKIDLQREGIDVRIVSPGFVKTDLTDQNDFEMPFCIDAEQAAAYILKGLGANTFDISFPKRFTVMLKLLSAMPSVLRFKVLSYMSRHPLKKVPSSL